VGAKVVMTGACVVAHPSRLVPEAETDLRMAKKYLRATVDLKSVVGRERDTSAWHVEGSKVGSTGVDALYICVEVC
jgi:hypothetical protein